MAATLRSKNKLRTIPAPREEGSADAVILHGMCSWAGKMIDITRALQSRGQYRHIARFDLGLAHRAIPQIIAKKTAERIASTKVRPALARGRLIAPLHLLGHSNGGYVCLFLARELGPSIVRSVFTLGTPRGLPFDYEFPATIKLFHLRGGYDAVPFGADHAPGDGEWIITFPEESHCSLHAASDSNGVADIITFLAGKRSAPVFVDGSGKMHPWHHCREKAVRGSIDTLRYMRKLEVCDGLHDTRLTKSKKEREKIKGSTDLAQRISTFFEIRERFMQRKAALEMEATSLRSYGVAARKHLVSMQEEIGGLQKRAAAFDKIIRQFIAKFNKECSHEVSQLTDALSVCEQLAKGKNFGNQELEEINGLLRLAIFSHRRLNELIRGRTRISPQSRPRLA